MAGLDALAMPGDHQLDNASAALALLEATGNGDVIIRERINDSLGSVAVPGRQERLSSRGRQWLLDGAHNEDGARALGPAGLVQRQRLLLLV